MELSPDQLKSVESLGALNYSAENIAMYLGVDKEEFNTLFSTPAEDPAYKSGNVRYHYDRGMLMAQAEIDKANLKRAKDGNMTSIQQYKKDVNIQNFENHKKKVLFKDATVKLESLQALIERGEIRNMPEKYVKYYDHMEFVRALQAGTNSKNYIINMVMVKYPEISKHQATAIYNDSLNFFNLNNPVKVEAWANIYADLMDEIRLLAIGLNDFETARRCIVDAAKLRGVGAEKPFEIPPELLDRRPKLYTNDIKLIGGEEQNRNTLGNMIDAMDISEFHKKRLRQDSDIESISFEVVEEKNQENED